MTYNPADLVNIYYTQHEDGAEFVYQSYANPSDLRRAYDWILDQGYEIVGQD